MCICTYTSFMIFYSWFTQTYVHVYIILGIMSLLHKIKKYYVVNYYTCTVFAMLLLSFELKLIINL